MKFRFRTPIVITVLHVAVVVVLFASNTARANNATTFTQTIVPGPQVIHVVDDAGSIIEKPVIPLTPTVLNSVLGTPEQKLRIMNPTHDADWSVTIAPTEGPDALWVSSLASYDVNDQNQNDGPDPDTQGGRLSIDPSRATVQAIPGIGDCPSTSLSLGSASSFDAYNPVFSSITLLSGSALFTAYCGWDVTGIHVQQIVPPNLPHDIYKLHLTITII